VKTITKHENLPLSDGSKIQISTETSHTRSNKNVAEVNGTVIRKVDTVGKYFNVSKEEKNPRSTIKTV